VVKDDPRSEHLERGSRGVAAGALATAELRPQTSATYIYNSIYLEVQFKREGIPKTQREREREREGYRGRKGRERRRFEQRPFGRSCVWRHRKASQLLSL
jgi:hypothetical protein